jgi:hypothetical protein
MWSTYALTWESWLVNIPSLVGKGINSFLHIVWPSGKNTLSNACLTAAPSPCCLLLPVHLRTCLLLRLLMYIVHSLLRMAVQRLPHASWRTHTACFFLPGSSRLPACIPATAPLLPHTCCCTHAIAHLLLHDTPALHACYCTPATVRLLLYASIFRFFFTHFV